MRLKSVLVGWQSALELETISRLIERGSLNTVTIDGLVFVWRKEVENYKPSVGARPKTTEKSHPRKSN